MGATANDYINQRLLRYNILDAGTNNPLTLGQQAHAIVQTFQGMVNVTGVDGDIPWAVGVIDTLIHSKATSTPNYFSHVVGVVKNHFFNIYVPAIRNALSPFFWDPQIQSYFDKLSHIFDDLSAFSTNFFTTFDARNEVIFKLVMNIPLDINERAVAARNNGQTDLSAFKSEMTAFLVWLESSSVAYNDYSDDSVDDYLQKYIAGTMVIIANTNQRCYELLQHRC